MGFFRPLCLKGKRRTNQKGSLQLTTLETLGFLIAFQSTGCDYQSTRRLGLFSVVRPIASALESEHGGRRSSGSPINFEK